MRPLAPAGISSVRTVRKLHCERAVRPV